MRPASAAVDRHQPEQVCTFCGYPVPRSVTPEGDPTRPFCSSACERAFSGDETPFAGELAFKQRPTGVAVLEAALPRGIPGNATVLLAGHEGTRREALLLEVVWRALQRDEPVVLASVDKPPSVLVDSFLAHGWNVLPYMDGGDLVLLDLFTQRLADRAAFTDRNDRWNGYLQSAFEDALVEVRDPSDVREIGNQIDGAMEDLEMIDTGLVGLDSMTELASFSQDVQAANFLREVRSIVCKNRYVPLVASASVPTEDDLYPTEFPRDHEYLFDGIVDLELADGVAPGERITRLSVRKMDDTQVRRRWIPYEFHAGAGFVPVDLPPGR